MKKYSLLLVGLLIFARCQNKETAPQSNEPPKAAMAAENALELTPAQLANAQIQIGKAELRTLKGILRVNGVVDVPPQNLISVSFPLGGYLKNTSLLPGMPVKKGRVIATLEDPAYIQLQQDYLTTAARLDYLQQELKRQQELNAQKINAEKTLQQVQSDYRVQQISLRALGEKLRLIGINPDKLTEGSLTRSVSVYSPINGYVSKVNVNIGKYLAPTDVMFQLVNTDDIHANLTVFEKDISKLAIGQKVAITAPNLPNRSYSAEIILIGRDLNENRAVEVHCHFERFDHSLSPGMFLVAEVQTTESNALTVPTDAVVRFENKQFVFVAKSEKAFEMKEVQLGTSNKDFTQIRAVDGVDLSKENVVLKNAYTLLSKLKNTAEE